MSLLPCPSCDKKIVIEVKECPYCEKANPFKTGDIDPMFLFFVWLLALFLTISLLASLFFTSEVHHFFKW